VELALIQKLDHISNRLSNIEKNISRLDEKLDFSIQLQRNHLIRVKNGEFIDDNMILMGRPYNDLSPSKSFDLYNNDNIDYIILDVSESSFYEENRIESAINIPFEQLRTRSSEIQNKTTPILIISEKGLKSIRAAELLVQKGFFNVNNISGGHKFWPGHKNQSVSNLKSA